MEKQQSATTVRVLLRLLFLIGFLILTGCSGGSGSSETSGGQVEPELAGRSTKCTNGTWEISSPAEHGMDEALLDKVRQYAFGDGRNTQGVVVVRNGVIVEEWYADWADSESCATSWSMAKSFASTLIGIAIDQGDIGSLDDLISDYLTQWQDTDKEDITLFRGQISY